GRPLTVPDQPANERAIPSGGTRRGEGDELAHGAFTPSVAGDDGDGADVVPGGVLVVGAVDRLLHRVRGVVGAEQYAVLLGGGVRPVGVRLVAVVLVVAAPLDRLAGVQHGRVAELLEVRLIEALVAIEQLAERAVGV